MPDFIDKDAFLKDVLPECKYPVKLIAAVERQPIVHIDDMTFKIQNELQAANPSGILEITFVRHAWWTEKGHCTYCGFDMGSRVDKWTNVYNFAYCPNCGSYMQEVKSDEQA